MGYISMTAPETIVVDKRVISCDGGKGPLGHPVIYLNMGEGISINCPYCGRRFKLSEKGQKTPAGAH